MHMKKLKFYLVWLISTSKFFFKFAIWNHVLGIYMLMMGEKVILNQTDLKRLDKDSKPCTLNCKLYNNKKNQDTVKLE